MAVLHTQHTCHAEHMIALALPVGSGGVSLSMRLGNLHWLLALSLGYFTCATVSAVAAKPNQAAFSKSSQHVLFQAC